MAILENGVKIGNRAETFIRSRTREFVTRERERGQCQVARGVMIVCVGIMPAACNITHDWNSTCLSFLQNIFTGTSEIVREWVINCRVQIGHNNVTCWVGSELGSYSLTVPAWPGTRKL